MSLFVDTDLAETALVAIAVAVVLAGVVYRLRRARRRKADALHDRLDQLRRRGT